jgi:L,D-transpeptidase YcbB
MGLRAIVRVVGLSILLLNNVPPLHAATVGGGDPPSAALGATLQELNTSVSPGIAVPGEVALVRSVYDRVGMTLLWSTHRQLSEQARELVKILHAADTFGLAPSDYAADVLIATAGQLGSTPSEADSARFDVLLTRAAVRLISQLHYGRIDPRAAGFELAGSRSDLNVAAAVGALASAPSVGDAVRIAEPHFYHYGLLKGALLHYRALAAHPELTHLPSFGKHTLHVRDTYVGAPALRKLLVAVGDLSEPGGDAADASQTLDAALVEALEHFQDRHGLTADGTLGASTFAALTTPMAQRVRQIELTLERWRWLPAFDAPPIIVNIPEFRLFAFDTTADRVASILQMPVIVGQTYPSKRTPVFVGDLQYVVFRPYWDVPRSITVREMLPAIRAHSDYLQRNHLEIVRGQSDDAAVMQTTPETIAALAAGQLRLRQRPGDDNALGLIKFLFPNTHNVYMHSTPAHQLFQVSRRAFSHGCIRVSDPTALAAFVLRNAAKPLDHAQIDAAMHGTQSLRIQLSKPIRVMILYGTAMATEAGPVQFFDDIYGHDRKLEALLSLRPVDGGRDGGSAFLRSAAPADDYSRGRRIPAPGAPASHFSDVDPQLNAHHEATEREPQSIAQFEKSAFVRMFPRTDCYGRTKSDTGISAEICHAVSFSR